MRKLTVTASHLLFLIVTLIWIYPLLWTLTSSLKTNQEIYNGSLSLLPAAFDWSMLSPSGWSQLGSVFHFDNYSDAWYISNFGTNFFNTVIFALSVTVIVITLCSCTGYALGKYSFPGKKTLIGVMAASMFIPHGYTIIPVWQMITASGLAESRVGMILAEVGGAHLVFILLFTAYFAGMPKELEESAVIDGASLTRTFLQIMLPLARPVIATTGILQMMYAWNAFFIPLIFSIQRPELQTLGVGMLAFTQQFGSNVVGMAAGATIAFIPLVALFIGFQRFFVEGIAGAVKS